MADNLNDLDRAATAAEDKPMRDVKNALAIQGTTGNWDYDPYMHGMYNGMEFVIATLDGCAPDFRDAPAKWIHNDSNLVPREQVEALMSEYLALESVRDHFTGENRAKVIDCPMCLETCDRVLAALATLDRKRG